MFTNKRLKVPNFVPLDSSTVWLECGYELQSESGDAIQWFKDAVEFSRHMPHEYPSSHAFCCNGINLDVSSTEFDCLFVFNLSHKASS